MRAAAQRLRKDYLTGLAVHLDDAREALHMEALLTQAIAAALVNLLDCNADAADLGARLLAQLNQASRA